MDNTTYEKVSEAEVRIVKQKVVEEVEVVDIAELKQRRLNTLNAIEGLTRQLDEQNACLAEIDTQINEAGKLGVTEAAVDVV